MVYNHSKATIYVYEFVHWVGDHVHDWIYPTLFFPRNEPKSNLMMKTSMIDKSDTDSFIKEMFVELILPSREVGFHHTTIIKEGSFSRLNTFFYNDDIIFIK